MRECSFKIGIYNIKVKEIFMKKYLILFAMFLVMPAYAMCPVEDGAAVCSLPGFREQVSPIYNPKKTGFYN